MGSFKAKEFTVAIKKCPICRKEHHLSISCIVKPLDNILEQRIMLVCPIKNEIFPWSMNIKYEIKKIENIPSFDKTLTASCAAATGAASLGPIVDVNDIVPVLPLGVSAYQLEKIIRKGE
jgi:hypothetical protein